MLLPLMQEPSRYLPIWTALIHVDLIRKGAMIQNFYFLGYLVLLVWCSSTAEALFFAEQVGRLAGWR
jgi:hypothetical protein